MAKKKTTYKLKPKSKLKTKPKKKAREYDNSARAEKSMQTQKHIVETLVQLLVKKRGGEVQIDELSKASGVSERTIFRFFKDKAALHEATDVYLRSYLESSVAQIAKQDVFGFSKYVFSEFDEHEDLVMAYLFSPFGQHARNVLRKKFNALLIERMISAAQIKPSPRARKRLALMASMVNAKIWYDLRNDADMSGAEIGEAVSWALKTLLQSIESE